MARKGTIWSLRWLRFKETHSRQTRSAYRRRLHVEGLESRRLLAITSSFDSQTGLLNIVSDGQTADQIVVTASGGNVLVNGANPGGGGTVAASNVHQIQASGGLLTSLIDLSAVTSYHSGAFVGINVANEINFMEDGALSSPPTSGATVYGSAYNDVITGTNGPDVIDGGEGADTIDGLDGGDQLDGGEGNDTIDGGAGNDIIDGSEGNDSLEGGTGDDTFVFDPAEYTPNPNTLGTDTIVEAAQSGDAKEVNTLDFHAMPSSDALTLDVGLAGTNQTVVANVLTLNLSSTTGITRVVGGAGSDSITGNSAGDNLIGGPGNDSLIGGTGDDVLEGDGGDDSLSGGAGSDTFVFNPVGGSLGTDTVDDLSVQSAPSDINTLDFEFMPSTNPVGLGIATTSLQSNVISGVLNLQLTTDTGIRHVIGGAGNDTLGGNASGDILEGGAGNDVLLGGAGDDELDGGDGNDSILGGDGNDALFGGAGDDTLAGLAGNDTLYGGAGNDQLGGGTGDDTFAFRFYPNAAAAGAGTVSSSGTLTVDSSPVQQSLGSDTIGEDGGEGNDTIDLSDFRDANPASVNLSSTSPQTITANLTITISIGNVENVVAPVASSLVALSVDPYSNLDFINLYAAGPALAVQNGSVDYYLDSNHNGSWDVGDALLASQTNDTSDDGAFAPTVQANGYDVPGGTQTFFAVPRDSGGAPGQPTAAQVYVGIPGNGGNGGGTAGGGGIGGFGPVPALNATFESRDETDGFVFGNAYYDANAAVLDANPPLIDSPQAISGHDVYGVIGNGAVSAANGPTRRGVASADASGNLSGTATGVAAQPGLSVGGIIQQTTSASASQFEDPFVSVVGTSSGSGRLASFPPLGTGSDNWTLAPVDSSGPAVNNVLLKMTLQYVYQSTGLLDGSDFTNFTSDEHFSFAVNVAAPGRAAMNVLTVGLQGQTITTGGSGFADTNVATIDTYQILGVPVDTATLPAMLGSSHGVSANLLLWVPMGSTVSVDYEASSAVGSQANTAFLLMDGTAASGSSQAYSFVTQVVGWD